MVSVRFPVCCKTAHVVLYTIAGSVCWLCLQKILSKRAGKFVGKSIGHIVGIQQTSAELMNLGVKEGVDKVCKRPCRVVQASCGMCTFPGTLMLAAGRPCWLGAECLEAVPSWGLRA